MSMVAAAAALVVAMFGLRALVRMRTWGVLALGAAGVTLLALAGLDLMSGQDVMAFRPALGGSLLLFAAVPWVMPMRRFVAG
jgi:hypothetical protein